MTNLSPAALAVMDAANASATNAWSDATHQRFRSGVAAALRAVVQELKYFGITEKNILAIAAELEDQHTSEINSES